MIIKRLLPLLLLLVMLVVLPGADNIVSSLGFTMYYQGDPESPKIAITVDDLYGLDHLESILDLCQQYNIHMTFFALGTVIKEEDAALWQRIVDEGHEIGNHTFYHPNITEITAEQLERQLTRTQEALNAVLREPYTMTLFRPPYGSIKRSKYSSSVILKDLGYTSVIMWSVDTNDASSALKKTKNGSILLFHTNKKDVRCLTKLIPKLLEKGFEPVTVSELLQLPGAGETVQTDDIEIDITEPEITDADILEPEITVLEITDAETEESETTVFEFTGPQDGEQPSG